MKAKCCICQNGMGEEQAPRRIRASFSWRNQGLCQECYGRARLAIARAYGVPLAMVSATRTADNTAG